MTTEQEQKDALVELIEVDLPKDIARIKSMKGIDVVKLQAEITGTVLFHVRQVAMQLMEYRNWTVQSVGQLDAALTDVEERVDAVVSGGETQFTPEDAEKFTKLIAASKWMATELLKTGQTADGTKKLQEFVALATECEQIVDDGVLEDDDEDEDEDGDDEDDGETEESH